MKNKFIILSLTMFLVVLNVNLYSQAMSGTFQNKPSSAYFTSVTVKTDFETTILNVKNALKEQGFGIVSEINMQEKLKNGADKDIPKYMILGACNPAGAYQAVQLEENIGVMLPCNVIVRETAKGEIVVAAINPIVTMKVTGNEDIKPLAEEITAKLNKVIESLR